MPAIILLLLLLLFAPTASATFPSGTSLAGGKHCNAAVLGAANGSTTPCVMNNVVAGHTVLVGVFFGAANTFTVTATEALTCPGANFTSRNDAGFIRDIQICYVVLASNHATFTVNANVTTGANREVILEAWEVGGLGAVDAGSSAAAIGNSVNYTTAANNEFTFTFGGDFCNTITPTTPANDTQFGYVTKESTTVQYYKHISMVANPAASGAHTAGFTATTSATVAFISTISFAISGGSPEPSIRVNQQSELLRAGGSGAKNIGLSNSVANSKMVIGYASNDPPPGIPTTCTVSTGETCTCPNNSRTVVTTFGLMGLCYADMGAAHAGAIDIQVATPNVTSAFYWIGIYEMIGLANSIDAGSEAAANAQTVNYTTAATNEYTFSMGIDATATYPPNVLVPGNSFAQEVTSFMEDLSGFKSSVVFADKTTASSGSNTWSYTVTGSTVPGVATFSFTPLVVVTHTHTRIF